MTYECIGGPVPETGPVAYATGWAALWLYW